MKNNIKKEAVLTIILFLFIDVLFSFATATSMTVCLSYCNYTTIQSAIYNSSTNDIISVLSGTYTENVTVNVSITLNGSAHPTISGGFNISASNVELSGFNITQGLGWDPDGTGINGAYRVGILITSGNNTVYNNYFNNITSNKGDDGVNDLDTPGTGGIAAGIYLFSSSSDLS